jgi:dTDP-4-dehydrorhamnose reductase
MASVKALIFGRTGQVGWELSQKLAGLRSQMPGSPILIVDYPKVDFSQPDEIRKAVRTVEPAVIINAAAYTAVDKAEGEPDLAAAINSTAPGVLAEESKRLGCTLVHYSTDYVFDGTKKDPYVETDPTNPLNVYGKTKLAGERAIEAVGGAYLILRTSWVYGPRGSNFLLTMLRLAGERAELRIVDDQVGAPTSSESIALATVDILAQVLSQAGSIEGRSGVYNFTCNGSTTWFGFAKAILTRHACATGSRIPKLIPIKTSDFPRPATRPANSRLSGKRLEDTFGVRLPEWEVALSLVLEKLREGTR